MSSAGHSRVTDFLRLTRFWNLAIIGLTQYFVTYFLINRVYVTDLRLFLLSVSTILIAAAGYIINDYYDVKIDLVNKPDRVVIGKSITRRYALFLHSILSLTGVAMGLGLNWKIGVVNFLSAFLLWWYSNSLKRLPFIGNFSVAILTGLSLLVVSLLFEARELIVIVFASFAFFMTLVREIIKDMEDLKGDKIFGCKTLPIVLGFRKTKMIVYVLLFVFCGGVFLINYWHGSLPLEYFLVFLFVPLAGLLALLIRSDTVKDFYYLSVLCKIIMLLGIFSMAWL